MKLYKKILKTLLCTLLLVSLAGCIHPHHGRRAGVHKVVPHGQVWVAGYWKVHKRNKVWVAGHWK